ncbi:MAG: hypothetical protein H0Z30_10450 [Candidatus Marinimicrobia bacterium]|nr:hypothetical protein [Candidatus Neomarinimicrobiota bacterium]
MISHFRLRTTDNIKNYYQLFTLFKRATSIILLSRKNIQSGTISSRLIKERVALQDRTIGHQEYIRISKKNYKHSSRILLLPGFSLYAENNPGIVRLGRALAFEGYDVYIPKLFRFYSFSFDRELVQDIKRVLYLFSTRNISDRKSGGVISFGYCGGIALKIVSGGNDSLAGIQFLLSVGAYSDLYKHFKDIFTGNFPIHQRTEEFILAQKKNSLFFLKNFHRIMGIDLTEDLQYVITRFLARDYLRGITRFRHLSREDQVLFLAFYNREDSVYYNYFEPAKQKIKEELSFFNPPECTQPEIPILLLHSVNDYNISFSQSLAYFDKIHNCSNRVVLGLTDIVEPDWEIPSPFHSPGRWMKENYKLIKRMVSALSYLM